MGKDGASVEDAKTEILPNSHLKLAVKLTRYRRASYLNTETGVRFPLFFHVSQPNPTWPNTASVQAKYIKHMFTTTFLRHCIKPT